MDELVTLEVTFKVRYPVSNGWYGVKTPEEVAREEKYYLESQGASMADDITEQAEVVSLVSVEVVDTESE